MIKDIIKAIKIGYRYYKLGPAEQYNVYWYIKNQLMVSGNKESLTPSPKFYRPVKGASSAHTSPTQVCAWCGFLHIPSIQCPGTKKRPSARK